MASLTNINSIPCSDIGAVDGISAASISKFDNIDFCLTPTPTQTPGGSPTPTPTVTPTVTPTPTPTPSGCAPGCCLAELCFGRNCGEACACNNPGQYYLHQPCQNDPCELPYADGIFTEDTCTEPAGSGYYTDGRNGCWYWDGVSSLSYSGPC